MEDRGGDGGGGSSVGGGWSKVVISEAGRLLGGHDPGSRDGGNSVSGD